MKAYELVKWLVARDGGALKVAREMNARGFQPTLHKICDGQVSSPKRTTAERIARHFQIPVDALYDDRLAQQILTWFQTTGERLLPSEFQRPPEVREPSVVEALHPWPFVRITPAQWARMTTTQRDMAERLVEQLLQPRAVSKTAAARLR